MYTLLRRLGRWLQLRLSTIESGIAFLFDFSLFLLVRLVLVEVTIAELRRRSFAVSNPPTPPGKIAADQAQFIFEQERLADQHTDDKVKQLLTLSSSLAALVTTVALSRFGLDLFPTAVILLPLLAAVYICLGGLLDVRVHSLPTLSEVGGDPSAQEWARGMISAAGINRGTRFLRVSLYRAALRWFLLALLVAPLAVEFRDVSLDAVPAELHEKGSSPAARVPTIIYRP